MNTTLPRSNSSAAFKRAWVLAVTSGKGGVGKTFVSANLAAALAKRGHRVLVLDADLGSRSPHVHVGAWRGDVPLQVRWDLRAMARLQRGG